MIDETAGWRTVPVRAITEVRAPGQRASTARVSALPRTGNADFLVNARGLGGNGALVHRPGSRDISRPGSRISGPG